MKELLLILADIETNPLFYLVGLLPFGLLFLKVLQGRKTIFHADQEFAKIDGKRLRTWRIVFWAISSFMLLFLAGLLLNPQLKAVVQEPVGEIVSGERDILALIDLSGSMGSIEEDNKSKAEIARDTLFDFIKRRTGDRIGLIIFTGFVYFARPLLSPKDHGLLFEDTIGDKESLKFVTDVMGGWTEIGKALNKAVSSFDKASQAKSKVIILITDLQDYSDTVAESITKARDKNITVYILGVKVSNEWHDGLMPRFGQDPGVKFFNVQNEKELRAAYDLIDEMEKSSVLLTKEVTYRKNFIPYLAAGELILALLLIVLLETVFRKIP